MSRGGGSPLVDIVDSHCHCGLEKYEPVETLIYHMDREGVAQAVLIQHGGQSDPTYLHDCVRQHPGRFCASMIPAKDGDGRDLREWFERGVRVVRLQPDDPERLWRVAGDLGMVVSVFGSPERLVSGAFTRIVGQLGDAKLVLEHLGGAGKTVPDPPTLDAFAPVLALAARPNIAMKIPAWGELMLPPFVRGRVAPLVLESLEAFGAERMMWGSDFPPVSGREGYHNALHAPMQALASLSDDERASVFGGAARAVFPLRG